MLERVRRRAWGLSGRLTASYILVTVAVVVLVEALVLGFEVPSLVNGGQLQTEVTAAAQSWAGQLSSSYPGGVPAGIVLGDRGQPAQPGLARTAPAGRDGAGLAPALAEVCAAYQHRLGVTIDARLDAVTVPAPVEHALLRITQEACANAVRHGRARRLTVALARRDGHVELAVRDTGTGFDPAAPHAGSGLAHIRDRVAELGGTVDIDSAPGRGAALVVRVPVPG